MIIFSIIKYFFKDSLNKTFLLFLTIFPVIIPPNKGDKKSIKKVGIYAPFVLYSIMIVAIINNSVNTINELPYLNKKELCVVSIIINSFLFFLILYYPTRFVNTFWSSHHNF